MELTFCNNGVSGADTCCEGLSSNSLIFCAKEYNMLKVRTMLPAMRWFATSLQKDRKATTFPTSVCATVLFDRSHPKTVNAPNMTAAIAAKTCRSHRRILRGTVSGASLKER